MKYHIFRKLNLALLISGSLLLNTLLLVGSTRSQQPDPRETALVQDSDQETNDSESRRMFRTFGKQRSITSSGRTRTTPASGSNGKSNSDKNDPADDAFIGFTVWEMRESASGTERRSFTLKKPDGKNVVLRPFRLGANSQLVAGRSYVFSVESARAGYLYIIDREQFANKTLGAPVLLFPTKGVRGGNNKIAAGYPVEIPDQKTESAYFEATRNGKDHVGEALTIVVSSEPLVDVSRLKENPITLDPQEVLKWEKQWSTRTRWADNSGAVGHAYTEQE